MNASASASGSWPSGTGAELHLAKRTTNDRPATPQATAHSTAPCVSGGTLQRFVAGIEFGSE